MEMKSYKARRNDAGTDLVTFLAQRMETSKKKAKALLDRRQVYVNRQRVWMAKHKLSAGDIVEAQIRHPQKANHGRNEKSKIPVLFSDRDLLVVSKPPGMLVQGKGSLESALREQLDLEYVAAVHRLDRDTSGCLLLAKNEDVRDELMNLFRQRTVEKQYLAIVHGRCRRGQGSVQKRIDGKSAVTHVAVIASNRQASLVSCKIETGRTHQIRKHLASIGNPVVGDKRYGMKLVEDERLRRVTRQMLHAHKLGFPRPRTGRNVDCTAPLTGDFKQLAKTLHLRCS